MTEEEKNNSYKKWRIETRERFGNDTEALKNYLKKVQEQKESKNTELLEELRDCLLTAIDGIHKTVIESIKYLYLLKK
jgi:hypothetical protein